LKVLEEFGFGEGPDLRDLCGVTGRDEEAIDGPAGGFVGPSMVARSV